MKLDYLLITIIFILLINKSYQQDNYDDDSDDDDNDDSSPYCSFISGEGCMNGICKYCALCVPSDCILATPYSTGNNDGSTCAVTNQPYGYDFYNYCLSSGDDDDCATSTECYPYRQGNIQHTWNNLTCDQSTCQLMMKDGSQPPVPTPLENIPVASNNSTHHPAAGTTNSGYMNPHHDRIDFRHNTPALIALTTTSAFGFICFIILLIRLIFFRTKYWHGINKYLFCGVCVSPKSRPPSFRTLAPTETRSIHSHADSNDESLPSYHRQDPSLPKYEQAIVSQIRGLGSSSSMTEQPVWVPVYFSTDSRHNIHMTSPIFNSLFTAHDWAAPRHRAITSSSIEEITDEEEEV